MQFNINITAAEAFSGAMGAGLLGLTLAQAILTRGERCLPPIALPTGAKPAPAPAPEPEPVETREATPEESAALIARLTH